MKRLRESILLSKRGQDRSWPLNFRQNAFGCHGNSSRTNPRVNILFCFVGVYYFQCFVYDGRLSTIKENYFRELEAMLWINNNTLEYQQNGLCALSFVNIYTQLEISPSNAFIMLTTQLFHVNNLTELNRT